MRDACQVAAKKDTATHTISEKKDASE